MLSNMGTLDADDALFLNKFSRHRADMTIIQWAETVRNSTDSAVGRRLYQRLINGERVGEALSDVFRDRPEFKEGIDEAIGLLSWVTGRHDDWAAEPYQFAALILSLSRQDRVVAIRALRDELRDYPQNMTVARAILTVHAAVASAALIRREGW